MSLVLLFHFLLLNMFRILVHPSSGACDLLCYGVVRLGWCGILIQAEALTCFSLHKDTTPPQPNDTVTPTHIEPGKYNT